MSFVKASPWDKAVDLDTMPFGKQKGEPIEQVDTGMLRWWLKKMDSDGLRVEYRKRVLAVLAERGDRPPAPQKKYAETTSARRILGGEIRSIVKAWFGRMSMRFHPDKGGSNEQQMVVIEAYKTLMSELEKWEKGS